MGDYTIQLCADYNELDNNELNKQTICEGGSLLNNNYNGKYTGKSFFCFHGLICQKKTAGGHRGFCAAGQTGRPVVGGEPFRAKKKPEEWLHGTCKEEITLILNVDSLISIINTST